MQEQAIKESTYLVARKQDKPSATYYLGAARGLNLNLNLLLRIAVVCNRQP